jgi:serine protein kinase
MAKADQFLAGITDRAFHTFRESQAVLSFDEFVSLVIDKPKRHLRNSAQYFVDMVDSFGSYKVETPVKNLRRYRVFDADFVDQEGRIFGQERVQHELISHIRNFVKAGRIDKLLLLHGPNGSAKTSIVQALIRAAEVYSTGEEGPLYQFSWIFPKKESVGGSLGFSKPNPKLPTSFAYLPYDEVDARLVSDQRDHPLLLLSLQERQELFSTIRGSGHADLYVPEILRIGELSFKNRQIFDALLSTYNGDLAQVLRHVRIERFYYSRRYKRGISVVEPQMSVDADIRQITNDQSVLALPTSLRHLSLYDVLGPLVDANRGLIEYSDLLKRPIDAWKYLLVSCEQAQVSVGSLSLFFDLLMIATSNELHLTSFREYPDWPSFKGRIELIRTPYLLRSVDEEGIYHNQIKRSLMHMHIAPHSIAMAARWAVLTRLEPPSIEKFPSSLEEIIKDLSPEEKLELYNSSDVPVRLSQKQAMELKSHIKTLYYDHFYSANYEGRFGASPREVRMIILNASQDPRFDYLSVEAVFEAIELLIEQRSTYEFLRRESVRGYRDAPHLLSLVKHRYASILEDEVRSALGFYDKESYVDLFTRYIMHVSAWTKKERLMDPLFQRQVDADEQFMASIEQNLLASHESKDDFRGTLISHIGAYMLENPQATLDYQTLFSGHIKRLKDSVYREQKNLVNRVIHSFLRLLEGDIASIEERDMKHARALQEGLYTLGYNAQSARSAMSYLMQYGGDDKKSEQLGLKIDI